MTNADGHRLILLRHAKSAYPGGVVDHDRPLAPRGDREAALAGRWIAATQPHVDAVLCSSALRARETLRGTGIAAETDIRRGLYGAGAGEVLQLVGTVPEEVRTLLVIAHAPGLPAAAAVLAGPESDPDALAALRDGFPTSAMAVLDLADRWTSAQPGAGRLLAMHVPR